MSDLMAALLASKINGGGGGGSSDQILFINGTKDSQNQHVTLDKTFTEIYDYVKNGDKTAIVIVPNHPFAGNNFYILFDIYDSSSSFPKQVNFKFMGIDTELVNRRLDVVNVSLALDDTEGNVARMITDSFKAYLDYKKELTGTLTAGETTLTFTDSSIQLDSTIEVFTSVYGVSPVSITTNSGSMTLTFEAQQSSLGVKVRLS